MKNLIKKIVLWAAIKANKDWVDVVFSDEISRLHEVIKTNQDLTGVQRFFIKEKALAMNEADQPAKRAPEGPLQKVGCKKCSGPTPWYPLNNCPDCNGTGFAGYLLTEDARTRIVDALNIGVSEIDTAMMRMPDRFGVNAKRGDSLDEALDLLKVEEK